MSKIPRRFKIDTLKIAIWAEIARHSPETVRIHLRENLRLMKVARQWLAGKPQVYSKGHWLNTYNLHRRWAIMYVCALEISINRPRWSKQ